MSRVSDVRKRASTVGALMGKKREAPKKKEKLTVSIDAELVNQLRNARYHTKGATISSLVSDALRAHLQTLEDEQGEPFEQRPEAPLPAGRPAK